MSFKPVDPKVNFAAQEEELLKFWNKQEIFKKSLELRKNAKRYVFFEGPPTANGKPGIHHVLARAFKDLWPRYKTMQGLLVERKAGWDTHGLPVEIEVEKALGLKNKSDIEKYGVAKFNEQCKESVWKYKEDWEKLTERMAFWLDMSDPYITYDPRYIESLWWIIKQIWDKGLLYEGYKVVPRCTRCGTALSSHEVAQGYREIEENSVFIKFKVKGEDNTYILSWTTTPWTLPGNVALAVNPDIDYIRLSYPKRDGTDSIYILAKDIYDKDSKQEGVWSLFHAFLLDKGKSRRPPTTPSIMGRPFKGKDLVGLEYEPLFPGAVPKETENYNKAFKVYPADFVTTNEGTGVVHTAVMYGDDDYQLGEQVGLPKVHTVSEEGLFLPSVKQWAGRYVKDPEVEKDIVGDLKKRGLLFKEMPHVHDYPFCWRCDSPLLYYAARSWFIAMSKLRDQLIANNQDINWVPDHIKEGRFGEWLKEVKDWAFSRERYWGTPLPLWKSDDGDFICVGSFDELKKYAKDKSKIGKDFDPHKPFIDEIVLEKDGKEYKRVSEIVDVWFDSGCMPFAQWYYPHENKEKIDKGEAYPADFIAEAIDQTRGWFYTLLAVSTLLSKGTSYKNVVCLGHVLDKHGKKMSKSKGNIVNPWKIFGGYGSDALRWYLYSMNQPGMPKNFDEEGVKQIVRRFMLTLWNTYSFFITYANIDGFDPGQDGKVVPKNILDRWIIERTNMTILSVERCLDEYDTFQAALTIEKFIDDLSNWYVRRSRRRFWKGEMDTDKEQGYIVFYNVLKNLAKMMAPFMPFLSESIYANLRTSKEPISVHLTNWPSVKDEFDKNLILDMETARSIVETGLSLREKVGIKVRQPLQYFSTHREALSDELIEVVKDELNVKEIRFGVDGPDQLSLITPELKLEGVARELVRSIQVLRKEKGFAIEDRIKITWASSDEEMAKAILKHADYIKAEVLAIELTEKENRGEEVQVNDSVVKLLLTPIRK